MLDKKHPEKISIKPFRNDGSFDLTVYDDINVLFGAKGTGKSDILAAIAAHYSGKGLSCRKFEAGTAKLEDVYDLAGKNLQVALEDHDIEYCNKEIEVIRKAQEVNITSLSRYRQFFSESQKNKKANRIKIKDYSLLSTHVYERDLESIKNASNKIKEFLAFTSASDLVTQILSAEDMIVLTNILNSAIDEFSKREFEKFVETKTAGLFNGIIEIFKSEISRKTGTPTKPSGTGLRDYAFNRMNIEIAAKKTLNNINKKIKPVESYVGSLDDKGELYCKTEIVIQDGSVHTGRYKPIRSVKKNPQKKLAVLIKKIGFSIYSDQLFNVIAELNAEEDIDSIPTILELLVFDRYFTIDGEEYIPSTGENSMILLHSELNHDKEIYILDEPEKSLGNEYISNVIVPLIKEKAKAGKKIFIATHDANIAVRTLPYNSIYRHHDQKGYTTYVGNPFSNNLIDIKNNIETKSWKEVSMKTLEGGKEAFGERGKIYGNS